jgi:succinoglycan biosynthesis transport protein ExoP
MAELVPYQRRPLPASQVEVPAFNGHHHDSHGTAAHSPGIREYLQILRRQIWIVLPIFLAVAGLTLYKVLSARPEYRATAVVRIADARRAITGGLDADLPTRMMGNADVILSQIQILTSRSVVGQVVGNQGGQLIPPPGQPDLPGVAVVRIDANPAPDSLTMRFEPRGFTVSSGTATARGAYGQEINISGIGLIVHDRPSLPAAEFRVVSREKAIQLMLQKFRASPRPKTDVIDLSFTGFDPKYAQRMVNAMALTFQVHNATSAQQESRRRRMFLEEQMKTTQAMLQNAQSVYSNFRSQQQVFSSREKASTQQAGIATVQMERAKLDAERRTYEALLDQAQRQSQGGDANLRSLVAAPGIAANPVIQSFYRQLTGYEQIRDSLITQGAAATNPDVQAMNTLISQSNSRLISAVRSQIQSLQAQIASLDRLQATSSADIARLPATEAEEVQLAQQVETIQKMAEQLQEEHQKARMAEAVEAGQVEIVDLADVPVLPVPGGKKQKLALGFLIGAVLSVGAAVVRDGMNRSIAHRDDIERVLQVPGLGVVPRFAEAPDQKKGLRRMMSVKASNGGVPARRNGNGADAIAQLDTSEGEAYRTIRTNLMFSQAAETLRNLVVTSASPSEGKSTTAANVAASFAHQGMRVLLLDCDLRKARIHRMFQVPRTPGLTEVLLERATHEDAARQTSVTGLYILTAGEQAPNSAELLGGERMRRVLSELTGAYDIIILDTPPLLAASDAAVLATIADGVVLVVRAGSTEVDAGRLAVQQLTAVGARIVGAVLNDPDSKVPLYGKYYNYEYYGSAD